MQALNFNKTCALSGHIDLSNAKTNSSQGVNMSLQHIQNFGCIFAFLSE